MATHSAVLTVKILTDASKAAQGMQQASTGVDKWKGHLQTAAKVATGVLVGLGAAAVSFGKAAADDAQGAAVLANSLTKSTGATKAQVDAVEDWITKTSLATGVADDDLRPAMGTLARATGSVTESQKAMTAALDISAATGKDVKSVSDALAKGYAGNTTSLGRLVPGIDKATLATGDMHKIMGDLAKTTGGAAAAAADTAAGKMARMQVSMQEAKESIGSALLPAMSKFAEILGKVGELAGKHSTTFAVIAGIIAGVAAAIIIVNAALSLQATILALSEIQWLATWAAAALPVVLVIAAIAAVIAIFVLLYKKSATFKAFVDTVWAGIKTGAKAVAAFVQPLFEALFRAVKVYVQIWWAYLQLVFNLIKGAVKLVVAIFTGDWQGALDALTGILGSFKEFFTGLFTHLPGPVKTALDAVKSVFRTVFNTVKTVVRTALNIVRGIFKTVFNAAKTVVRTVMAGVKTIIRKEVDGIRAVVKEIRAIFAVPFNAAKALVRTVMAAIRGIIRVEVAGIRAIWGAVKSILTLPFTGAKAVVRLALLGMRTLLRGAVTSITTIWDGLTGIVAGPFDAASDAVDTLIGWISDLIDWIAKIHIPDLGGLAHTIGGIIPGRAAPAPSALGTVGGRGDPSALGLAGRGRASAVPGAGPTIIVQGALDPEAVARQIKAILAGHDRRVGLMGRAP